MSRRRQPGINAAAWFYGQSFIQLPPRPRYTVEPESPARHPSLYQVVDAQTGERSIPAALSACERIAAERNERSGK